MRALVVFAGADEARFCARTIRSLAAAGISGAAQIDRESSALGQTLHGVSEPVLLASAGAWLASHSRLCAPPPSATGRPLIAIGACRQWAGTEGAPPLTPEFRRSLVGRCGSDLNRTGWLPRRVPTPPVLYLETEPARRLGALLLTGAPLDAAVNRLIRSRIFRSVHLQSLDAFFDRRLRVLQVVTTIQTGGAERVTVDLAEELQRQNVPTCVAALGAPTRLAFPEPANFADLSSVRNDPAARAQAVADTARRFGADVVHAHLLKAAEARAIRSHGLPLVITIHNMPQSWPVGLADADERTADLLLACSKTVEAAARARELALPVRTVWNGIDPASAAPNPARLAAAAELRARIGAASEDFVVAAIANPRRQKRLERLPEIMRLLSERLAPRRKARLLIAGEPSAGNRDAAEAMQAIEEQIETWSARELIHWTGSVGDIGAVLAASDVLISVSDFEGLSLAHLEALAAGVPVLATAVGGTPEIAAQSDQFHLLPVDAAASEFVDRQAALAADRPPREPALPKSFTRYAMAQRYRFFYGCVIDRSSALRDPASAGLWLVTNNFSTGGAQSSARRLLLGLQARGVKVRAAVVQERPEYATPGRRALIDAGVPVAVVPPLEVVTPEEAVEFLHSRIQADRPQAVVFWNLITSYKVLLADALTNIPVFDVSPGEMYFESLARHFAQSRTGHPYADGREYGRRLSGVIVKYEGEMERAREATGAPVHVIRNGVPVPADLSPPRDPGAKLVLGTAARIAPQKRLEDLFSALRIAHPHLPPYVLRIAGGVEAGQAAYARELRSRARGLPVEWCGELPDATAFLRTLDLFLMISEPAGCPNASLEAMAAGLPVIATDVGGASEQVIHEKTGLLTPARSAEAFAEAIVRLAHDAALRQCFGTNARRHVAERFSMELMIESYARIFGLELAECLNERRGAPLECGGRAQGA